MTTRTAADLAAAAHADTLTLSRAQTCGYEESLSERTRIIARAQRIADRDRCAVQILDSRHTVLTTVQPGPVAAIELEDCDDSAPVFGP